MAIALVQAVKSALHPCGGGSAGSMTVGATGSGNLLVLMFMTTSGSNILQTGMTGGGSWVHPGGDSPGSTYLSTSGTVDAAYVLSSSPGATTISWNMSSSTFHDLAFFYEFSTASSFTLDTAGTRSQSSFTTTPAGVALTLSGSNDVIIQGLMGSNNAMSTIDGAYTGNGSYDSADSLVAAAYAINTASGTAPTWGSGNNTYALNAIAFKEAGGGGGFTAKFRKTLSPVGTRVGSRQVQQT